MVICVNNCRLLQGTIEKMHVMLQRFIDQFAAQQNDWKMLCSVVFFCDFPQYRFILFIYSYFIEIKKFWSPNVRWGAIEMCLYIYKYIRIVYLLIPLLPHVIRVATSYGYRSRAACARGCPRNCPKTSGKSPVHFSHMAGTECGWMVGLRWGWRQEPD